MTVANRSELLPQYGHWTVIGEVEPVDDHRRMVEVRCDCGTVAIRRLAHLRSGASESCGCLEQNTRHGQARAGARTPEYNAWVAMRQRCTNPKNPRWKDYGGRGITVCAAWLESFEQFLADMGPRPSAQHSIDRIDNDGHYEPRNCRWATMKEQAQRKRDPRKLR